MSDEQGSRVGTTFGPYHFKRLLGRGGMGEVYEAENTVKEWPCAVKLMSESVSKDPVFRERMKREARTTGRLQEPHVVPIHDYGEIDGQLFLEMRLIDGVDLDSILKRFGPLTPPRAVAIISQVASALDAAHAAGIMHRDVKPQNVLITRDDFAYLVDFGIASATSDEKLTQLGTAVGTWKYMAPERFSNDEVTYRADIYSLACVLHECLTGAPPYRADSASMLVTAHLMDPIPQASTVRSGIPKALDGVIARGMAKKPEDRYASASDLALAAHEALSTPDQDHADNIVRRSQEATLLGPQPDAAPPPAATMAGTALAPSMPTGNTPPPAPPPTPYSYPGSGPMPAAAGSGPQPSQGPSWAPSSGPVPTPSGPTPQYQGGGWGGQPPSGPSAQQFAGAPSWNQGQPRKPRNPWPIIAAVAGVLLVVVVGAAAIVMFTGDSGGGTTPTSTSPPPKPIAEDRLAGLLLTNPELNTAMGSSTMQAGKPITAMDTSPVTLSSPECQGALYTSQEPTYSGTGYTAISGLISSEPGDNYEHLVDESVVSFPSADKATAFVQSSVDKWKACASKTITITSNGKTYRWTFSSFNGNTPNIWMTRTQEGADGWACQRALSVANNVVVDINACGYKINNQGSQIADQIVKKINSLS